MSRGHWRGCRRRQLAAGVGRVRASRHTSWRPMQSCSVQRRRWATRWVFQWQWLAVAAHVAVTLLKASLREWLLPTRLPTCSCSSRRRRQSPGLRLSARRSHRPWLRPALSCCRHLLPCPLPRRPTHCRRRLRRRLSFRLLSHRCRPAPRCGCHRCSAAPRQMGLHRRSSAIPRCLHHRKASSRQEHCCLPQT